MAYELQHLKPETVFFNEHELLPFTLELEVWAIYQYGSINKMYEELRAPTKERPFLVFDILHKLLKDKTKFKKPIHLVKEFIDISKQAIINNSALAYKAIKRSLDLSAPIIINPERYKAKIDMLKAQGQLADEVCYGTYYDTLASRYGYSIDQFYNLTMRQLHILLKTINEEKHNELSVSAALQGRELKPRMEVLEITEEQEKENEESAASAHESLLKRYNERKANGK